VIVDALSTLKEIYGAAELPKPFDLLQAAANGAASLDASALSRQRRLLLEELNELPADRRLFFALGLTDQIENEETIRSRVQTTIAQLLPGRLAEEEFESVFAEKLQGTGLSLHDSREIRDDTDYRIFEASGKPVFRLNVKFHGTLFVKAKELVGLEPEDCFALATYKIKQGLDKQDLEFLPYMFVVASCPVPAAEIGRAIPRRIIDLAFLMRASKKITGKRLIEEKLVDWLCHANEFKETIDDLKHKLRSATWRILSARRADNLLRQKLFERVYAVRVRAFNMNYKNAEVDMHLSLKEDMTPLGDFLEELRLRGLHGIAGKLERGAI
jgi:hypothetical protein